MKNHTLKSALLALTFATATLASSAFAIDGLNNHKVVVDQYGQPVLSQKFKNCVRTEWQNTERSDPCAPPAPPEPEIVAPKPEPAILTPARTLQKADRTIYFEFDKATLTADSRAKLDSLATALTKSADVQNASIVGYADQMGANSYNLTLSERRAQAVQDYISDRGYLNTSLAKVRGLGETNSLTDCEATKNRAAKIDCLSADRRVEVEINFLD